MDIKTALRQLAAKREKYRLYARYYDGNHRLAFATNKYRSAFGALFTEFADNLCPVCVDAVADRLTVTGFAVEDGPEEAGDRAWAIWNQNRMDRRAGDAHLEALRSGDGYAIVWPGPDGRVTLFPNRAEAMTVGYNEDVPGVLDWAAKAWAQMDGKVRLNLYFTDRIEKYVTPQDVKGAIPETDRPFEPFNAPGEPWPLPNPWGVVPVFHFASNAGVGEMGRSELANVIPIQDALNKSVTDLMVAMEFVALPQRWATGIEVDIDPATQKPIPPWTPGVDRILVAGDPAVKFGEFGQADLTQFLAVQDGFRSEVARISGVPLHYLMMESGGFPSGESLKTSEARFTAKVRDRMLAFGNVWEDALRLAVLMDGGPDARLSTQWEDPEPRNDLDMANVAKIKAEVGVPRTKLLEELGYNADEIAAMETERAKQEADQAKLMAAMQPARPPGQPTTRANEPR